MIAQIRARFAPAAAPSLAGEQVTEIDAKKIAQDVGEITEGRSVETTESLSGDPLVTESIVTRPLVRIRQDRVGFGSLLELLLGLLVTWVPVRVKAHRELSVGGLDLGLRGFPADRQDLVVIAFCRHFLVRSRSARRRPAPRPLAA